MLASIKISWRDILLWMSVSGFLAAPLPTASAQSRHNPNPGIFPPDSRPYGHTYGEWSAKETIWSFSLPFNYNPLTDTAPVDTAQKGKVWYIGGAFVSTNVITGETIAIVTRNVNIPRGKALFFPIASAEASTVEGNMWPSCVAMYCASASTKPIRNRIF